MADALHNAISVLLRGSPLSENETHAVLLQVMDGNASDVGLGMLLTALALKKETVDEIVGAAAALRDRVIRIPAHRPSLLDTCGTGGDGLSTFNISTATALVIAACGVPIAKHANRSFSSKSGSADALEALGVRVDLSPEQVGRSIDELGIGFCFAPVVHGAMKHAAPVRRRLGFRTIFNLVGPLTNPADARFQLLGASRVEIAERLAEAAARLGTERTLVVCGNNELDEVSLWGTTAVFRVEGSQIDCQEWNADTFGLPECRAEELRVDSAVQSAAVIRDVLTGSPGAARNIVLINAAAGLIAAKRGDDPRAAVAEATEAIDSGAAKGLLERLIDFTAK